MLDWNNLRYFLAVAKHGSTLAAGRSLGVDQSTVQRRLVALEMQLGQRLVERLPTGYHLTEVGLAAIPLAEAVAASADALEQSFKERSRARLGIIRMTCPEPVAFRLTEAGFLDRFHNANPDLRVELVLSDQYVDLAHGDADVALRSGDTDADTLVGRKIADSLWAVYASRNYVACHGAPASIAEIGAHPLIGFEEGMAKHRAVTWLHEIAPHGHYAARNTSVLGLIYATKSGVGVCALPVALGDKEPDLIRVLGPVPELTRAWRLLTLPEIRNTHRISAFFDFVLRETQALKPILTG